MTDEELAALEPVAEGFVQAVHRGDAAGIAQFAAAHSDSMVAVSVLLAAAIPKDRTLRETLVIADLPGSPDLIDWTPEQLELAHDEYIRRPWNHPPEVTIGEMLYRQREHILSTERNG